MCRLSSRNLIYAGGKLIKESESVLEEPSASQMPATAAGNVAGSKSCQNVTEKNTVTAS